MSQLNSCPDRSLLLALANGEEEVPERELHLQHLELCEGCTRWVEESSHFETLVDWIRQAKTKWNEEEQRQVDQCVNDFAQFFKTKSAADPANVPGLAEHTRSLASHSAGNSDDAASDADFTFLTAARAPDEIGRLGGYRVLKVLGTGGMGIVLQAEDSHLKRKVALKVMQPRIAASAAARERFLREAQATAALEHDHIVPIFQVGEDNGIPFIAMPLLKGESLDKRLRAGPALSVAEIVRIGLQTALGLSTAHDAGLVHRDIKPANLWLEQVPGGEFRIKILDFGLARAANGATRITQQGVIVGTPAFMAPEQGRAGNVDHRCDLFSLGCVLYRLCTGRNPFHGGDTVSTLVAVALEKPSAPRQLNAAIPAALSELIEKLLAKSAADRPQSAAEVVKSLRRIEANLGDDVQPSAVRAQKRIPWALAGVLGGIAASIVTCVILSRSDIPNRDSHVQVEKQQPANVQPKPETEKPVPAKVQTPPEKQKPELVKVQVPREKQKPPGPYALEFDGKTGVVLIPTLQLDLTKPLTMEATVVTVPVEGFSAIHPIAVFMNGPDWATISTIALNHEKLEIEGSVTTLGTRTTTRRIIHPPRMITQVALVVSDQKPYLFVNGKKYPPYNSVPKVPKELGQGLLLGAQYSRGKPYHFFKGQILQVRVSQTARYDKDYTPTPRLTPDKDTTALYWFDEGEGTVLRDSSGHQHHGQIHGAKWVAVDRSIIPQRADKEKPFLLVSAAGKRAEFKHLIEAITAMQSGDVIHVHGNGPFRTPRIELDRRGLDLRAAPGYRPLFERREKELTGAARSWIVVNGAPLRLEGCDFRWEDGNALFGGGQPWELRHCRFLSIVKNGMGSFSGPHIHISDSLLATDQPLTLGPDVEADLTNNLLWSNHDGIALHPQGGQTVRLVNNTLHVSKLFSASALDRLINQAVVEARGNAIYVAKDHPLLEAVTAMKFHKVRWKGDGNLYGTATLGTAGKDHYKDLAAWKKATSSEETGSQQVSELLFRWDRFRTHEFSTMANELRELAQSTQKVHIGVSGPQWNLIGPGEAYVRALAAASKAIPPGLHRPAPLPGGAFVLVSIGKDAAGYPTLQNAVDAAIDGDTVEIRTDGPFPGAILPSGKNAQLLTILAAPGYCPVLEGDLNVSASNRLALEGLLFRKGTINSGAGPSSIRRIVNCAFEDPPPTRLGFDPDVQPWPDINNCWLPGSITIDQNPRGSSVPQFRNSVVGAVELVERGPYGTVLQKCVVLGHLAVWNGQSINAYSSLFLGPYAPLKTLGPGQEYPKWNATSNMYLSGQLGLIEHLKLRLPTTENNSAEDVPLLWNPQHWRLAPTQKFGANVDRLY